MKFLKKWGILLVAIFMLAIILALILVGTKSINKYKEIISNQEASMSEMENFIDNDIGPLVDCYVINTQTRVGDVITEEMLSPIQVPEKVVYTTKMIKEKVTDSNGTYYVDKPETTINVVTNLNDAVGKQMRVALGEGQLLLTDYVVDYALDNTERIYEVALLEFPTDIQVGDYVDFRIRFTFGEDFIAIPHKRVEGVDLANGLFTFHFTEDEINTYNSMLIDTAMYDSCDIYVLKYTDIESQTSAQAYYPVNTNISEIIAVNPNILNLVKEETMLERQQLNTIMGGDSSTFDERTLERKRDNIKTIRDSLTRDLARSISQRIKDEEAAAKAAAKAAAANG